MFLIPQHKASKPEIGKITVAVAQKPCVVCNAYLFLRNVDHQRADKPNEIRIYAPI